jgi:integrase
LHEAVEAFLLTKQVAGCTLATTSTYRWWLKHFTAAVGDVTPITVRQFFAGLQHRSASHQHQAFRTLRTFFRWCIETGALADNPLRGFTMRTPKTLPTVPTDDELRAILTTCPSTLEGTRNRPLILVLADSALRASEVLHLLVEDWRPANPSLFVRRQGPQGPGELHRSDHHASAQDLALYASRAIAGSVPVL